MQDSMIVTTLTTPLIAKFKAPSLISWLGASFFIASAVSQPLCGQLIDVFSRRTGLVVASAIFLVGNVLCGCAANVSTIVAGRALSGFGGGALVVIVTVLTTDIFPRERRGYWQGLANISYGSGHGFGGLFGGWMYETFSWRIAFLAMVPVALLLIIGSFVFIPADISNKAPRTNTPDEAKTWAKVDCVGLCILPIGLCLLLLGLNVAAFEFGWRSAVTISLLGSSLLVLTIFVIYEKRFATRPVLPIDLLGVPDIAAACAINWLAVLSLSVAEFYLPLFFHYQGSRFSEAGLRVAPISLGAAIGSFGAGWASTKYPERNRLVLNMTLLLSTISAGGFVVFDKSTAAWITTITTGCCGLGFGGAITVTLVIVLASARQDDHATLTSMLYLFRATGGAIGLAVAGVVSQTVLAGFLEMFFADIENSRALIGKLLEDWSVIETLPKTYYRRAQRSQMASFRSAFELEFAVTLLTMAVGLVWAAYGRWSRPNKSPE